MSNYFENSLGKDEHVVLEAKQHLLAIFPHFIRFFTTKLAFTNKKAMGKIGLLKVETLDAPLSKITSVSFKQGLLGKIFGYGTVVISVYSDNLKFYGIKDATTFRKKILEQIEIFTEEQMTLQATKMANAMKN